MDEIEKLLRKANKRDRQRIREVIYALTHGQTQGLKIAKLTNTSFFRVRVGNFRIIFSIDRKKKSVIIEAVRFRNEETYK